MEQVPASRASNERGTILVLALFFVIFAVGLVLTGSDSMKATLERTSVGLNVNGHANQFARAGLIEAIRWFRQQSTQPVVSFDPQRDMSATPPILETIDPDIGIVREFRIQGNVWGRYEIWKPWDEDPVAERLAFRKKVQCEDLSATRGMGTSGGTWRLRCVSYLFDRRDDEVDFDLEPNSILGVQILETEVSRLFISPPGMAAINAGDPNSVSIGAGSQILGGSKAVGVLYRDVINDPRTDLLPAAPGGAASSIALSVSSGAVSGASSLVRANIYRDTPKQVFGVKVEELRSMASLYVSDVKNLPRGQALKGIVFADVPALEFDAKNPLRGSGLLFVNGDLTIGAGSNSFFSGIVYVTGEIEVVAPAEIRGTIIGRDKIVTSGSGDYVKVEYDQSVLDAVQRDVGTYRISRAIRRAQLGSIASSMTSMVSEETPGDTSTIDTSTTDTSTSTTTTSRFSSRLSRFSRYR
ncbi:MAG: hypothetical protein KDB80_11445 [Planctomycetes bacterium]|nr:hypothetical protein [Planctomycetota bacterium]